NSNGGANRVHGPTSALSSFLREHGIRVPNQSRRARRERELQEQQQQQQEQQVQNEQQEQQQEVSLNRRVTRNRTAAANGSGNKKNGKGSDDDDDYTSDDEDDYNPPSSSRRAITPGRALILFCTECKSRFARKLDEDKTITTCPNCRNGDTSAANKKKASVGRKKNIPIVHKQKYFTYVPSLQDICIGIVAKYIEEVEDFGIISDESVNKLAKIICRNRKLNDLTAKLFMTPHRKHLKLYDCTNMTEDALLMLSQFCYQLERLELIYCGRMTDKVLLEGYANRLHQLKAVNFSGAFLVTKEAWIAFFKKIGSRLESFELRHSARFDKDCLKAMVQYCPNLTSLKLAHIGQLDTDWLALIGQLQQLNTLEIAWLSEDKCLQTKDVNDLLEAVGENLTELSIRGGPDLSDSILTVGILKNCRQLKKLTLEGCGQLTSEAFVELFSNWQENFKLTHLNIARCLLVKGEALKAIIDHSGKTLEYLNIHSLEKLTPESLEYIASESLKSLNCGFVRSMDDFVLLKLIKNCPKLKDVQVWGCHAVSV
ncbi:hypothetical protein BDF20DRAFT_804969, partial [Mycotypha africana]|uniref:uncharacterized protein n=1 Tax=Mycotypha africana TaxID=64632 RepID=UPI0023007F65